jgi:predicted enzyme related to lactoylglutathione lyase
VSAEETYTSQLRALGFEAGRSESRPMSEPNHTHHAIDYIEFTVTDMKKAQDFYSSAFGWEFTDYAPGYAGIQGSEREVGGFRLGEVLVGGPLIVLYSDDLESTLERVKAAGGKIAQEPFEFPGGRRFHFIDPSGNELAVWQSRSQNSNS